MKQTLEQRLRILESKVFSKTSLKEDRSPQSLIKKIKFNGGEMNRFSSSDWRNWQGSGILPDGGDPFITEIMVDPKLKSDLEFKFHSSLETELTGVATVILDYSKDKRAYTVSFILCDETGGMVENDFEIESFEQAIKWISKNVKEPLRGLGFQPSKWYTI